MREEENQNRNVLVRQCPKCNVEMKFYPGCCGNLPLWRCEKCGMLLKWKEEQAETDRYLILK
ncbi:hypothetical protein B1H10_07630 [candidate division KSB1 bacterium 4484_188]|nr:MAG: hypothetical protein B1H10_07630 [candidate division KSB1 bacterium 4484_188]